jgi:glycerate kinase
VEELSAGLENWARVLTRDLGVVDTDLHNGPGTGASGGLGAGLAALGARLLPRFEVLLAHLDLDARLARADLVVTAEGAMDHQTPRGKVPAEVARRAKLSGRPVLALAGTLGEGAHTVAGVDAFSGILPAPMALAEALVRASELLTDATERALRMILLGARLPAHAEVSGTQRPSSVR